jgi:hypothetical protein
MRYLIKEIQDIHNGLTAVIYRIDTGYSVSLRDVGIFRIFDNIADARKYAMILTDKVS